MRKKTYLFLLLLICILLYGCGNINNSSKQTDNQKTQKTNIESPAESTTEKVLNLSNYLLPDSDCGYNITPLTQIDGCDLQYSCFYDNDNILLCYTDSSFSFIKLCNLSINTGLLSELACFDFYKKQEKTFAECYLSVRNISPLVIEDQANDVFYIYDNNNTYTFHNNSDNYINYVFCQDALFSYDSEKGNINRTDYRTGMTQMYAYVNDKDNIVIESIYSPLKSNGKLILSGINTRLAKEEKIVFDIASKEFCYSLSTKVNSFRDCPDYLYCLTEDDSVIHFDIASFCTGQSSLFDFPFEFRPGCISLLNDKLYTVTKFSSDNMYHIQKWDTTTGECIAGTRFDVTAFGSDNYLHNECDYNVSPDEKNMTFTFVNSDNVKNVLLFNFNRMASSDNAISVNSKATEFLPVDFFTDYASNTNTAREIREKYGVNIFWGKNAPTEYTDYNAEEIEDSEQIAHALETLDRVLSKYPDDFFSNFNDNTHYAYNIYLNGKISPTGSDSINNAAAFATEEYNCFMIIVDATNYDIENTMYHEITHTIYNAILNKQINIDSDTPLFDEEYWNKTFNPEGFSYYNSYLDADGNGYDISGNDDNAGYNYEGDYNSIYFVSAYSKTYVTEDLATLMEHDMTDPLHETYEFMKSDKIQAKLDYFYNAIREAFDSSSWGEKTYWEN